MSKEEVKNAEEQVRTYTWKSEEGKEITKSIDDLKPEEVAALERLNNLNINIARLNAELADSTILAEHYAKIAQKAFGEEEK